MCFASLPVDPAQQRQAGAALLTTSQSRNRLKPSSITSARGAIASPLRFVRLFALVQAEVLAVLVERMW